MELRTPSRLLALACALLFVCGCAAGDDEEAARALAAAAAKPKTALDVQADRVAATGARVGAQGAGPALVGDAPADRQLPPDVKAALRGEIEPWLFAWRAALGTFRADELARTDTRPLALDRLEPFDGNAPGEDLRLQYLALPSPGGGTVLDPYVDWSLDAREELVHARRDGPPTVALIDLRSRVRQRLFDARPPFGRFDGAHWLDAHRFVVFAAERFAPNPWRGGPVLYVVDLEAATVTRYAGPGVDFTGFRDVEKELERRFRSTLPNLIFS
jgi:hypothetical protein